MWKYCVLFCFFLYIKKFESALIVDDTESTPFVVQEMVIGSKVLQNKNKPIGSFVATFLSNSGGSSSSSNVATDSEPISQSQTSADNKVRKNINKQKNGVFSQGSFKATVDVITGIINDFKEMEEEVTGHKVQSFENNADTAGIHVPQENVIPNAHSDAAVVVGEEITKNVQHKYNKDDEEFENAFEGNDDDNNDDVVLEDYRIKLRENLQAVVKNDNRALCTGSGLMCDTCSTTALCVDQGDGTYVKHILSTCQHGTFCLNGTCSLQPNPLCDGSANMAFRCTSTGMYPDPYYCTLYHFCTPPSLAKVTANCDINYAYNAGSTFCDVPVSGAENCNDGFNDVFPVPLCTGVGQSGPVPGANSLYYLCKELDRRIYPFIYKCPRGGVYEKTKCVMKQIVSD